jgi:methionine sulfoxide reductase heme-binding subunit
MTSSKPLTSSAIIGIATFIAFVISLSSVMAWGWNEDGAVHATRYTARYSFYWFMAAWSASALVGTWPGGWRLKLMQRRRALGLSFAAAHSVHLVALLIAIVGFGHPSNMVAIVGGAIGYVVVLAMAATSNNAAIKALGAKRWKALHKFGGFFLTGIFIFDYTGSFASRPYAAISALIVIATAIILKLRILMHSNSHSVAA